MIFKTNKNKNRSEQKKERKKTWWWGEIKPETWASLESGRRAAAGAAAVAGRR